jgi:hypothetical protein
LGWKARPVAAGIALVAISFILIDPIGAGNADHPVGSAIRALVMLAILVMHDRLLELETAAPAQTLRQPSSRWLIP